MAERSPEIAERATQRPSRLVILGHPVAHSLSPVFQNAALRAAGIPLVYGREDVEPDSLAESLERLAADGAGGNITLPHKEAASALMSRCTPTARRVGAVNTFWTEDGALVGHNTDVDGAASAIRSLIAGTGEQWRDQSVVVCGAGGSAAATLVALDELGFRRVTIIARTLTRADTMVERLAIPARVAAWDDLERVVRASALVINATPVGLRDDLFPVPVATIPVHCAVLDLVYRAGRTPWIVACRQAGRRADDGLHMLIEQGAAAFESWFDVPAPRDVMWRALNASLPAHGDP